MYCLNFVNLAKYQQNGKIKIKKFRKLLELFKSQRANVRNHR